ncbi:MAG: hypothetical protein A2504_10235 [Bdellovibrionales bacterium RIFOXYD12_FULL_39_22]|nr:MAG: hypothetical protein A2385_15040 [Bdellovibrionales bacterium RIFOXYB1_FULL_39_21]OFZ46179.1 MAG: hypothetical protein A2404_01175 [Bdellovibrionales bacterium RIFOXYC1_FULL_39_130]OFZ74688.1 MAG: hypothetical protein A2560_10705 [Bdellovibrionales bacterium RIFOXYD1_FULL_39_84]OFZ94504.1 MAG: hypothetical protein A2504_10235 [Bdellovibrionales bacterium RIFOXYD12_FULL_39_22]
MCGLKAEYEYYISKKEEFLQKYKGQFLAIKGTSIIAISDDKLDAIKQAVKSHELGTFMVREVTEGDDIIIFHSRVAC